MKEEGPVEAFYLEDELDARRDKKSSAQDTVINGDHKDVNSEHVVNQTSENIFNIFKDEKALSSTLKEAKTKLASLEEQHEAMLGAFVDMQYQLQTAESALTALNVSMFGNATDTLKLDGSPSFVNHLDPLYLPKTLVNIQSFAEKSPVYTRLDQRCIELRNEIGEATRFVKMLSGAMLAVESPEANTTGENVAFAMEPPVSIPTKRARTRLYRPRKTRKTGAQCLRTDIR